MGPRSQGNAVYGLLWISFLCQLENGSGRESLERSGRAAAEKSQRQTDGCRAMRAEKGDGEGQERESPPGTRVRDWNGEPASFATYTRRQVMGRLLRRSLQSLRPERP